jgi:hypothetical protein
MEKIMWKIMFDDIKNKNFPLMFKWLDEHNISYSFTEWWSSYKLWNNLDQIELKIEWFRIYKENDEAIVDIDIIVILECSHQQYLLYKLTWL